MPILPAATHDRIQAYYDGLSKDNQALVTLIVAIRENQGIAEFTKTANRSSLKRKDGKAWTSDEIRHLYCSLDKADLGSFKPGRPFYPSTDCLVGIAEIASATQSLGDLTMRALEPPSPYMGLGFEQRSKERQIHGYYWDGHAGILEDLLINRENLNNSLRISPAKLSFIADAFCSQRYSQLPEVYQNKLLPSIRDNITWNLRYSAEWLSYLQRQDQPKFWPILAETLLLDAQFESAEKVAERMVTEKTKKRQAEGWFLKGLIAFLLGDKNASKSAIQQAMTLRAKPLKIITATEALVLTYLCTSDDPEFQSAVNAATTKKQNGPAGWVIYALQLLANINTDTAASKISYYEQSQIQSLAPLAQLIMLHAWRWRNPDHEENTKHNHGFHLLRHCQSQQATLATGVLKHLLEKSSSNECPIAPWTYQTNKLEPWERQLEQLEQFALERFPEAIQEQSKTKKKASRLAWELEVDPHDQRVIAIVPREQKCDKHGRWSAGRPIGLKRLSEHGNTLSFVTTEDLSVINKIHPIPWPRNQFELRSDDALKNLIDHPLVFRSDAPGQHIEVVRHELKLILTENPRTSAAQMSAQPPLQELWHENNNGFLSWWETPNRIAILILSKDENHLIRTLGLAEGPSTIPKQGRERLLKVVQAIKGSIQIFTDVEDANPDTRVETVTPNLVLQLHLSPWVDGLRASLLVQPLDGLDLHLTPGNGSQVLFGEVDDQPYKTKRILPEELARANEILRACPSLQQNEPDTPFQWTLPDPVDCLELLTESQAISDQLELHWPQGERFHIASTLHSSHIRLQIGTRKDWFEISGELTVAEDEVLQLQSLLNLLEKDDGFGRFVKLRDGQFLALTQEFRQRLKDLDAFSTEGKDNCRLIHPLAAHAIHEFAEETDARFTKKWITQVKRLRDATTYQPELPNTLQVELRPYQLEGFRWLARQAHWGVGACLADDMGLGKTIQALALLLHRAPLGPALVVAPTSVTRNWLAEAIRFAPTLRTRLFGPGERSATLKNLSGFDLVVCTYGLLPNEITQLAKVQWSTIVLDEAQAIKNANTQRWKAAVKLKGDFKIVTSGTPIENHVAELHALFQFINPGLLGSSQRFHVKFVDPIAKNREDGARLRLKRFIRPFILRRLKNQVLQDLPPRTDIVLRVEPSMEETAFYEALRRKAVKSLAAKKNNDENAGERSLRILAEIMKLRRACCHPQLVDAKVAIASSKLAQFGETLAEILANDHKVLVFSQFVDHLAYLRQHLNKEQIPYQYLDGQTPAKKRQQAVDAFQCGDGEVFLISLRAGGTGLNLTTADYVIHMDPWWNPAVEDQASDRAHRIGQRRPVTVYRLVVANTIEEKIVELHQRKRDLADSLLADSAGKLSPDQLLNLLRDER